MPPTKRPRETPAALQAYHDYEALGADRSIRALLQTYVTQSANGMPVPTTRFETLGRWSSEHGWQERLKAQEEREAELVREAERKRNKAFRDRVRTGIEVDVRAYLKSIADSKGAVLAEDAASLERMTKLFLALGGDPVAEKSVQEHTGPGGGPVKIEHGSTAEVIADPGLRALAAEIVARASVGAPDTGELRGEDVGGPVADGATPEAAE